jgi:hypothetical protein
MNRRTIEEIARYGAGTLSPAEERDLLRRAAADPDLRRALDAERAISRTLRVDRDRLPSASPESRRLLAGMLDQPRPLRSVRRVRWSDRAFSGFLLKGTAIAAVLTAGTVGLMRSGSSDVPTPAAAPAVQASPRVPRHDVVEHPVVTAPAVVPVRSEPRSVRPAAKAPRRAVPRIVEEVAPPMQVMPQEQSTFEMPAEVRTVPSPAERARTPIPATTITRDTMRIDVTIDLGKLSRAKSPR